VSISDLPRETEVQKKLHLGITEEIANDIMRRRSNVQRVVFDDMTRSNWPGASFDCVVAVEVLEHVEMDADFVAEVYRVLKPGGVFVMTTPNGDAVKNTNPDHKRHYTQRQLEELLQARFAKAEVEYAVLNTRFRRWGLQSWSARHPLRTARTMLSNVVARIQSSSSSVRERALDTRHLIGRAGKAE
jgi:SAM-dependent methyltransferase